ncbi:MAG: hypothetical protein LUC33_07305, partial [Prevotellaceae bacterium]|nr:hypothetical protein [Prevotellaceae bacterium]
TKGDVVNKLTSTSTDTPLSAYQGYLLNQNKQAKLTAGEGITISSANVISADISGYATSSELDAALDELEQSLSGSVQAEAEARQTADTSLRQSIDLKQDKLTAGEHITISSDNVISADLSDYATTDGLKAEAEAREQADAELAESVTETQESVEDTRTGFRALLTAMLGEGVTIEDGVVSGKIDQTSLAGIAVGAVNYETGLGFYFNEGEAYGGMYEAIEKLKAQLASVQEWIDDFELVTADDVASWFGGLRVEGSDGETDTAELVTRDDVAGWFGNSSSGSTGDSSSSSGVEIVTADDVKGWFNN